MSWFKIYNLWRQALPKNSYKTDKHLPYGKDDCFPLEWAQAISKSPSASSCLSTIQDFIEGEGFNNADLEKLVVNPKGETLWQIHQKTVDPYAEYDGFAWLIRYNALGTPTEWEFLPFESCRLGLPDGKGYISHIYFNPYFGTDLYASNKKLTKEYDVFNPNAVKAQLLAQKDKFKGQVLYVGSTTPLSPYYAVNEAHSAIKWMKIEAGVSDYHEDNINNGFLQPFMLVMKGDPSAPSSNPDYANTNGEGKPATVAQEFDDVIENNFMGAKRVGNMFVQWVNNGEEAPTAVALPANNNGDLFITLDNQATKKITVAWKVPSILANISDGATLGGDGNIVRVAVKLMQQRVVKKQRVLTDAYYKILSIWKVPYKEDIKITPYNPYPEMEVIDAQIWNTLKEEDKRKWIEDNTDIELIDENDIANPDEPIPTPAQAKFSNAIPITFNDSIKNTVKKAVEYENKMGIKCSSPGGRGVAQSIIEGKSMGLKQLKRIHSYLKRNEKFANSPFNEGCNAILYNQWGGKPMFDYLDEKLKDFDQWLNKTS